MEKSSNGTMAQARLESRGNKATRKGFGEALLEIGKDERVVSLSADLTGSVNMHLFQKAYPERFFNVGIAEANMISMAAGFATAGKIAYTATFANFATGRVYDQIRQSVCYSELNVKICASHSGLTLGEDGATHQILEDIGLMRGLPNMTVVVPCDYMETIRATKAIAEFVGPTYLRFSRPALADFSLESEPFEIGKSIQLKQGADVTIIACGVMVWKALQAAYQLEEEGVSARVINMHTIKPLDEEAIVAAAQETGAIVTAEEHQIFTGLSEAVAGVVARTVPVPIGMVGVEDRFGKSGAPEELLKKFGLTEENIKEKVKTVLGKKRA